MIKYDNSNAKYVHTYDIYVAFFLFRKLASLHFTRKLLCKYFLKIHHLIC